MLTLLGFKVQGDLGPITCYTSRQNKVVWYLKAPPKDPPSDDQVKHRDTFRYVGLCWQNMAEPEKDNWNEAARKAHLRISGYNLFTYWVIKGDIEAIRTIVNQTSMILSMPSPA